MSMEQPVSAGVEEHLDLINPDSGFVAEEVARLIGLMGRGGDVGFVRTVHRDTVRLFQGKYPGYRACNTRYHDLEHTTDTFLAMSRLMHGAVLRGESLGGRSITLGLAAALLHDTGYIQTTDDTEGTGARYTLTHISRSIDFAEAYFRQRGLSRADFAFCRNCLLCTGLGTRLDEIGFASSEERMAGQMLGAADLLGQMADRKYLEKLLFLYREFREGNVPGYSEERDILSGTLDFYRMTEQRLAGELGGVHTFLSAHFSERWKINEDLYASSIARNMEYIRRILTSANGNYRDYLRRGGVVKLLRETDR